MTTWLPLESNPDVMNKYIHKLGVPKNWTLIDVFGLDEDTLESVPKPVKALILLFPCSETYEKQRADEDLRLRENPPKYPEDLFYMKQFDQNACGTIALIHSIASNKDIELKDGVLKRYLEMVATLNPEERGRVLESDTAFTDAHQEVAQEGQTVANPHEKPSHHFIALIHKNGVLYELDGRKAFPVKHGQTSESTFLQDAAKVCKGFMAIEPEEVRFTIIALTPAPK